MLIPDDLSSLPTPEWANLYQRSAPDFAEITDGGPVHATIPKGDWNGTLWVGHAPGRDEVREGRPLIGITSRILHDIMAEQGINREQCAFTNIFRWKPRGDDINNFFARKSDTRTAITKLIDPYQDCYIRRDMAIDLAYLFDLIETMQPALIVALGNIAMYMLTGLDGIRRHRGTIHRCPIGPTAVLPTIHPAACRLDRAADMKRDIANDIGYAEDGTPGPLWQHFRRIGHTFGTPWPKTYETDPQSLRLRYLARYARFEELLRDEERSNPRPVITADPTAADAGEYTPNLARQQLVIQPFDFE